MDPLLFQQMLATAFGPTRPWDVDDLENRHAVPKRSFPTSLPQVNVLPALAEYPTSADANFAMEQGFDYGTGMEAFLSGDRVRTIPGGALGKTLREVTDPAFGTGSPGTPQSADMITRAALAANRIPIAALGFDPRVMQFDENTPADKMGTLGAYRKGTDTIFTFLNPGKADPSTPVHESIHRGIKILQDSPNAVTLPEGVDEEYLVRYLMQSLAGDPENPGEVSNDPASWGVGQMQREAADYLFTRDPDAPARRTALQELNAAAAREIARRRPGGPR